METPKIAQTIRKVLPSPIEVAQRYFSLIGLLNGIHITNRQAQLLAFTAIRGSISAGGAREEFVRQFSSSINTVNNMVAELQTKGLLVKTSGRITVHPKLQLDFTRPLTLQLNLQVRGTD